MLNPKNMPGMLDVTFTADMGAKQSSELSRHDERVCSVQGGECDKAVWQALRNGHFNLQGLKRALVGTAEKPRDGLGTSHHHSNWKQILHAAVDDAEWGQLQYPFSIVDSCCGLVVLCFLHDSVWPPKATTAWCCLI